MAQFEENPSSDGPGRRTRILTGKVATLVLAVGLFQIVGGGGMFRAAAAADADIAMAAKEADAAAQTFIEKTKDVYKAGDPPRQTAADVAPLLDTVFATAMLRAKRPAFDDTSAIFLWLHAAAGVSQVYELAGTGIPNVFQLPEDPQSFARLQVRTDQNFASYAPEIGRAFDATVVLNGALADILAVLPGGADAQIRQRWDTMRSNLAEITAANLNSLTRGGLGDDWRRSRLVVLNDLAPKLAKVLMPMQCRGVRDTAGEVSAASKDEGVRQGLATFNAALSC